MMQEDGRELWRLRGEWSGREVERERDALRHQVREAEHQAELLRREAELLRREVAAGREAEQLRRAEGRAEGRAEERAEELRTRLAQTKQHLTEREAALGVVTRRVRTLEEDRERVSRTAQHHTASHSYRGGHCAICRPFFAPASGQA